MSPDLSETETSAIRVAFARHFSNWDLDLPADCSPNPGFIQEQGWLIQYAFGSDDRGAFLDFYASHRMTNDRHVRLRTDGSEEDLPALSTMMFLPNSEADRAEAELEFYSRTREIATQLVAKGFDRFTINMHLSLGNEDPSTRRLGGQEA